MPKCSKNLDSMLIICCLCLVATLCHSPSAQAAGPLVELGKIYGQAQQNSNEYILSVRPEDVPVSRQKESSLPSQQISQIRTLLESRKFSELNSLLTDIQQRFEVDPLDEFQIFDAGNVNKWGQSKIKLMASSNLCLFLTSPSLIELLFIANFAFLGGRHSPVLL